jgi:hypothetical protein
MAAAQLQRSNKCKTSLKRTVCGAAHHLAVLHGDAAQGDELLAVTIKCVAIERYIARTRIERPTGGGSC